MIERDAFMTDVTLPLDSASAPLQNVSDSRTLLGVV
jgi:hypothetical protein